jgi:predicted nucleic acid-binding protein
MIAVDTSSWIAYLQGDEGPDTIALDDALARALVVLPPAVLAEILSDPALDEATRNLFIRLPLLELASGYWERVGLLRAKVLASKRRARLADALIAQSCLDYGVPLMTRDGDFQNFREVSGLLQSIR